MKPEYLHKINGVCMHVCSAEQMIAYNYAHAHHTLNVSGAGLALMVAKWMQEDKKMARYNWKAVCHLIAMHLDRYRAADRHILTSYEAVGQMFPFRWDN